MRLGIDVQTNPAEFALILHIAEGERVEVSVTFSIKRFSPGCRKKGVPHSMLYSLSNVSARTVVWLRSMIDCWQKCAEFNYLSNRINQRFLVPNRAIVALRLPPFPARHLGLSPPETDAEKIQTVL